MKRLAARPHHVGSPYDKDNADFIAGPLQVVGLRHDHRNLRRALPDADGPRAGNGRAGRDCPPALAEPTLREDATSGQTREQLPVYNAYSIDGDVTGELVYVNYGIPRDYEILAEHGIDVKGKIVHRALRRILARHQAEGRGGAWRDRLPHLLGPAR